MARILLLLVAAAAVAGVLIIISSDDDEGSEERSTPSQPLSAEDQAVADAIEAAAATRNTDDCARLATIGFLEQTERLTGRRALAACQFGLSDRGLLDEPLRVTGVQAGPEGTTADVRYEAGSRKAGLTARIRLDGPRLARIEDYAVADRRAMERALRNEILSARVHFEKEAADCAVQGLSALTDVEFEALLLEGSSVSLYGPVVRCDRAGPVTTIAAALRGRLPFLPMSALRCARGRLQRLGEAPLVRLLIDRQLRGATRTAIACRPRAVLAAYRRQILAPPLEYPRRVADCVVRRLAPLSPASLTHVLLVDGTEGITSSCGLKQG